MEVAVAGAAVGATIQVVMENLLSFSVEEIGRLWNFKEDLQKLKRSVTMILDFLEDAEMKQVTDKPVNRWLQKLDALAFDADYVFDQLNYQILRKKVKTDNKMKKLQVSSSLFASIPFVFRQQMARKIKNINKSLKLINQEATELGLQMRIAGPLARGAGTEAPAYWETDSLSEDPVFMGRENEVTKMVEILTGSLTDQQVLSVFPIVGMGGLGKTTLARKVHNDRKSISHFGERMWVYVHENFDPVAVLKKTLESLTEEKVDASREVVFDMLEGLVTGAVAERLGGMGYVCNAYCGTTPYPVSIVRMFNLSDETCKRIVNARLTELQPSNSGNSTSTDQLVDACNITEQKNDSFVFYRKILFPLLQL